MLEEHYEELRARAHRMMDGERRFLTQPATDYVHRAFVRARERGIRLSDLSNRAFVRFLTREMKWVRFDHIRHRLTKRAGGRHEHVEIDAIEGLRMPADLTGDLLADSIAQLSRRSKNGDRMVRTLELRLQGLTLNQIAHELNVSRPTATADLECAILWLRQHLESDD